MEKIYNFKYGLQKILFIRRDNIGDLICTTPAIHAVRQAYPEAKIGILVNSYNAEAIRNNPDIDEIYVYEKAKHVLEKKSLLYGGIISEFSQKSEKKNMILQLPVAHTPQDLQDILT